MKAFGIIVLLLAGAGQEPTSGFEKVSIAGIENAYRVAPGLYSGGLPDGEKSFAALKALGVKTILSVDGIKPDVPTAKRFGMRYVHLPVGYDGIAKQRGWQVIRAVEALPGPAFIHCHHGKHRGPTAVALCGRAIHGWDESRALAWLKTAGTSPEYPGLFQTVRKFEAPTAAEKEAMGTDFPEMADTPEIVGMMVEIDRVWDQLKAASAAGFPDEKAANGFAATLVDRLGDVKRIDSPQARDDDFRQKLDESIGAAEKLRDSLRPTASDAAGALFKLTEKTCTRCHARHRN